MREFDRIEEELAGLRERGYGDHRALATRAWMESDNQAIHVGVECPECGSFIGYAWRLTGPNSTAMNPERVARIMMDQFSKDTPESCAEAWRLNLVRRVMLS